MQPRKHENTKKTFGTQRPLSPQRRFLCHAAIATTKYNHENTRARKHEEDFLEPAAAKPATTTSLVTLRTRPRNATTKARRHENTKKTFWNAKTAKPAKTISRSRCDRTHGRSPPSSPKTQRRGQSVRRGAAQRRHRHRKPAVCGACDNGLLRRPLRVEPNPSCLRAFVVCLFRDFVISWFRGFVVSWLPL